VKKESVFAVQRLHVQYFYLQPNSISMVLVKMDKQQSTWFAENTRAVCSKYLFIMQLINFTSFFNLSQMSAESIETTQSFTFYVYWVCFFRHWNHSQFRTRGVFRVVVHLNAVKQDCFVCVSNERPPKSTSCRENS